jgi:hypothetical protein
MSTTLILFWDLWKDSNIGELSKNSSQIHVNLHGSKELYKSEKTGVLSGQCGGHVTDWVGNLEQVSCPLWVLFPQAKWRVETEDIQVPSINFDWIVFLSQSGSAAWTNRTWRHLLLCPLYGLDIPNMAFLVPEVFQTSEFFRFWTIYIYIMTYLEDGALV